MKIQFECLSCLLNQVLEAARMSTDDNQKIRNIINKYALMIPGIDMEKTSPVVTHNIHKLIKKELDVADPYQQFKEKHIQLALDLYPAAREIVKSAEDPLRAALIMSATGNSIDSCIEMDIDIEKALKSGIEEGFAVSNFEVFNKKLIKASKLMIIGDNSGEAVFDRLLIKELDKYKVEVTYVVRSEPVLNDITLKEAGKIGLDEICQVMESGSKTPGLNMKGVTPEFKDKFYNTDIIISKGQGNYETLSELKDISIFFLLKAKCEVIARELNYPRGSLIFKFMKL